VFELTPSSGAWTEKILYSFKGSKDGIGPYGGLIFDSDGNLYGTTEGGGAHNGGTVFEFSQSLGVWKEKVAYAFCARTNCSDGNGPVAGLTMDGSGNLFGTTYGGGGLQTRALSLS
jgi:uncharacterized repeat protein (TIGR03803 family)